MLSLLPSAKEAVWMAGQAYNKGCVSMFTKKPQDAAKPPPTRVQVASQRSRSPPRGSGNDAATVIGAGLSITGNLESKGEVQVEQGGTLSHGFLLPGVAKVRADEIGKPPNKPEFAARNS